MQNKLLFRVCVVHPMILRLRMCVLFFFDVIRLHVCAYTFKFKVHCGSALGPGASGLAYYCTPPMFVFLM